MLRWIIFSVWGLTTLSFIPCFAQDQPSTGTPTTLTFTLTNISGSSVAFAVNAMFSGKCQVISNSQIECTSAPGGQLNGVLQVCEVSDIGLGMPGGTLAFTIWPSIQYRNFQPTAVTYSQTSPNNINITYQKGQFVDPCNVGKSKTSQLLQK